ncbi:MAG: MBL fold metallo-hydrolase [Clostridia bacterium]|nr:MBL fold metallo-hydrolase [Clostridia bacterium]
MKLSFLGAAHEVTGSCTLLEACGHKILIDCGMEQGQDIYENCELPVAANDIDCVLLTHAHIDHSGKLPALARDGYDGPVYATYATQKLCNIMLKDSAHIQEFEAEWRNRKAKRSGEKEYVPVYTMEDAEKILSLFSPCDYGKQYSIADGITARFSDAGHLLGSSSIELTVTEKGITKTILFSGDIGNVSRPLIRDPQKPEKADVVVIESTYGNRLHGERPDYVAQLTQVIQTTLDRGGNVVIPSFAVGRTQELLYLIRHIKENNLVKNHDGFPVWVDSPMAAETTNIYSDDMTDYYDEKTLELLKSGVNPIIFDDLNLSVSSDESKMINFDETPKIILSASGMCEAGRIRHHLKHNLWKSESTILFVGYQSEGTLGRKLLDGEETVKLFGEEITVRAQIAKMDGISGHADKNMLLDWLKNLKNKPETVFVNHGDDTVCDEFAGEIVNTLGFPEAIAPYNGAQYDILNHVCIYGGNKRKIVKYDKSGFRVSEAFKVLTDAGRRLMRVIEHNRGGANKDLKKFTKEIDALSDKWDR